MSRSLLPIMVFFLAVSARAQTTEPVTSSSPVTAEISAAEAAKSAAEAAKSAAEAAKASAAALEKAIESMERQAKASEAKAEAPAAPAPESKPGAWAYQLGLSFISVTGNANAVTGKVSGQAEGTWGKWSTKITGGGAYGQTAALTTTETEVTSANANLSAKGARSLNERFNTYLLGGAATDRVASITYQLYGEAGVGITWFENKEADFVKSKFTTDLGFRYTREAKATYYPGYEDLPDSDIYAAAVKASFRYALTKSAVFTEELEILPDVVTPENLRATSTSAISAQIAAGVALSLGFKVRYIGVPAAGAKSTDTELSAGVTWAF